MFKTKILLFVAFSCIVKISFAQNNAPVISNMEVKVNTAKKQVTITYDLRDSENDRIEISLRVSDENKRYITINPRLVSGDIGSSVSQGKSKKIIWQYQDDAKAMQRLNVKLIADDLYKININEVVNKINVGSLTNDMQHIYGIRAHDNEKNLIRLYEVRKYIENKFKENKLTTFKQKAKLKGLDIENIIGEIEGESDESSNYILCAHYDTESKSPGADDNGSGVIGMLEAMRVLSGYNFKKSIRFIGFDGEEIGHLGSRVYVKQSKEDRSRVIKGLINFDMIGYYSDKPNSQKIPFGYDQLYPEVTKAVLNNNLKGDFILNTANSNSVALGNAYKNSAGKYVRGLKVISLLATADWKFTPELAAGDHIQFWKEGYPALQIGDTGPFRNKRLDTRRDLLKTVNFNFIANVVKATVATLAELAEIQHCTSVVATISLK
jgi:Peptidase family M28